MNDRTDDTSRKRQGCELIEGPSPKRHNTSVTADVTNNLCSEMTVPVQQDIGGLYTNPKNKKIAKDKTCITKTGYYRLLQGNQDVRELPAVGDTNSKLEETNELCSTSEVSMGNTYPGMEISVKYEDAETGSNKSGVSSADSWESSSSSFGSVEEEPRRNEAALNCPNKPNSRILSSKSSSPLPNLLVLNNGKGNTEKNISEPLSYSQKGNLHTVHVNKLDSRKKIEEDNVDRQFAENNTETLQDSPIDDFAESQIVDDDANVSLPIYQDSKGQPKSSVVGDSISSEIPMSVSGMDVSIPEARVPEEGAPITVKQDIKELMCHTCLREFQTSTSLIVHLGTHTDEHPETCKICPEGCSQIQSLDVRRYIQEQESLYACKVCQKSFSTELLYNEHRVDHMNDDTFKCTICEIAFLEETKLTTHMSTHQDEKPYKCEKCDKSFHQKRYLAVHSATHLKLFSCSLCSEDFPGKGELKAHMASHTGEKPYKCNICSKSFSQKYHLQRHTKTHMKVESHTCTVCGRTCSNKFNLTSHEKTHVGKTPYPCSICSETFGKQGSLNRHMKTHSVEKIFSCTECGKNFSRKYSLKVHMIVHTGEKPYECMICGKRLGYYVSLQYHMSTHEKSNL
ncbi:hypothetical protein JCM33374_g2756 [Metschnikowia sp. JCM 33374]|nr:hypothetical protein JCM33374_g2756 [Metschnikowia sp. JCM 33374]